jgi:hypothetical protein
MASTCEAVVTLDLSSRHGKKFLDRVASGKEDWRLVVLPRTEWRVSFIRDSGYDSSTEIVTSERVTIERPFREEDSGEFSDDVQCCGVWLLHRDAATAAKLLRDGWRFRVRHHAGFEVSRELRLSVVEFIAVPPFEGSPLAIGGVTVVDGDWKRTVIGGACSVSNR